MFYKKSISVNRTICVGSNSGKTSYAKRNEWYTPERYISMVREVLGTIDLDPFSCIAANETVGARRIFTIDDDAFTKKWTATTVFMNPPYSTKLVRQAANKFVEEWQSGNFESGIVLLNNATETNWYATFIQHASSQCFPTHRIAFYNYDDKNISNNTRGQVFLYFGTERKKFFESFHHIGHISEPRRL